MRSTFVVLFTALLVSGNLGAQSLEESYAKLCSDPAKAKSEACQILAKSLVSKLQGQHPPQAESSTNAQSSPWGPLARLVGTSWSITEPMDLLTNTDLELHQFVWSDDGRSAIELTERKYGHAFTQYVFRQTNEPGVLQAVIRYPSGTKVKVKFRHESNDVLSSDWFKFQKGLFWRDRITFTQDGRYSRDFANGRTLPKPEQFPLAENKVPYRRYSGSELEMFENRGKQIHGQAIVDMHAGIASYQQQQRAEKAERSAERSQLFGAVMQGVAQGLGEVNTGGYAESQANLNAAVADIQNAAAVERQQQARAAQDRQGRYNEEQVLAANAEAAAERSRQAKLDSRSSNPARSNSNPDAQPRPIPTAATQKESKCSEAPGFRKIFGYAEKTRELAMRSMTETPHLKPLKDVSCTQPPNLGYTLEGWWKCTAMAPTGLMVKHCPQSNSGVSSQ